MAPCAGLRSKNNSIAGYFALSGNEHGGMAKIHLQRAVLFAIFLPVI
jgi:hypothetical protein